MNNTKCICCGLTNFAAAEVCKRCGGELAAPTWHEEEPPTTDGVRVRTLGTRVAAVVGMLALVLTAFYVSLLESSEAATFEQKQTVQRAISIIERQGFSRDAFLLRRLANFRTTDNWWNNYVGHADAYAATNFPFQLVTLYPEFFKNSTDDVERAAILLHEARHLAGQGEPRAFASVWRDKERLGWTAATYGQTRVWHNVQEFTAKYAPELFQCGQDGRSDCLANVVSRRE